jgi:hypothetical protein
MKTKKPPTALTEKTIVMQSHSASSKIRLIKLPMPNPNSTWIIVPCLVWLALRLISPTMMGKYRAQNSFFEKPPAAST